MSYTGSAFGRYFRVRNELSNLMRMEMGMGEETEKQIDKHDANVCWEIQRYAAEEK